MKRSIILLITIISTNLFAQTVSNPDGLIDLITAPAEKFTGKIFFTNDWDGGDKDNQNVSEEMNRNPKIKTDVVMLSDWPDKAPKKVAVNGIITDAKVLADASKVGKVGIAM